MTEADLESEVAELLSRLTVQEKVSMMAGGDPLWTGMADLAANGWNRVWPPVGAVERLGIEGVRFVDGPRGVIVPGATTFPVPIARGATFDVELEEAVGDVIGAQARAVGANVVGAVCVNLLRHPSWGRSQETYGEDTAHLAALGVAATRGLQRHVMACVKHFAFNSMEDARFQVDVQVDERAAHEVYLRHFEAIVRAGVASVMSAYNSVNGEWCGQNHWLLTEVLKQGWGFDGFVMTDFVFGLRDGVKAALAGQDREMPFANVLARDLPPALEAGTVPIAQIDNAVVRLLRQQLRFAEDAVNVGKADGQAAATLARRVAQESIVLLHNDGVLPLDAPSRLAVIGRLADVPNTGDHGSSDSRPAHVVTPLEGIRDAFGSGTQLLVEDGSDLERAVAAATQADVAVVVVGFDHHDEGESLTPVNYTDFFEQGVMRIATPEEAAIAQGMEKAVAPSNEAGGQHGQDGRVGRGGDRTSLRLRPEDEELVTAVAEANPGTVVVLMTGGAVIAEAWREKVAALVVLWYPGQEGGHALADVLTGRVAPSGRLPVTFPREMSDLPHYDVNATSITYDLWHGYRKLDRDGNPAAYPFGFGLGYTTFALSDPAVSATEVPTDGEVEVTVQVHNTGARAGTEVVQLYVSAVDSRVERPVKELKAFSRIDLGAGQQGTVSLSLPIDDLAYWEDGVGWVVEPISYELVLARSAADPDAVSRTISVGTPAVGQAL